MSIRRHPLLLALSAAGLALHGAPLHAEEAPPTAKAVELGVIKVGGDQGQESKAASDVRTEKSRAAKDAPVQSRLDVTQPTSIVSRTFIEKSLTPLADYAAVVAIAPSIITTPAANGPGLGEAKSSLRGFKDGEYNMTFDGIPFGDTNNPTHHSTSYFPSGMLGAVHVERGPGNAGNLGQATFGGSINLHSRDNLPTFGITSQFSWGSWHTQNRQLNVQTGNVKSLNDLSLQFHYQQYDSDGYLTGNSLGGENYMFKVIQPLWAGTQATVLFTQNQNFYHQPDKAGVTLSQVAQFGKNYSLNSDPASQAFIGYNQSNKSSQMSYVGLESELGETWSIEDKAYHYNYVNQTRSGQDVSGATANTTKDAAGKSLANHVPGYTKLNEYSVAGNIARLTGQFGWSELRLGLWTESSHTERNTYDFDWTTGLPNYKESAAPKNIAYLQNSSWTQQQEFVEWAVKPMDGLVVTPGFKHMSFTRRLDAAINQTTRLAQQGEETYKASLPFLDANWRLSEDWSMYAQYAKGMLVPDLSMFYVNNPALNQVDPQTTTNYQVGVVHKAGDLVLDADVYRVDFRNKIASSGTGNDIVFFNQGGVRYQGVEGQLTWTAMAGLSLHVNGSLNQAKANDTGLQVASAPKSTLALGAFWTHERYSLSWTVKRVGTQWAKDGQPDAYRIPAYQTMDLNIGVELGSMGLIKKAKLQLGINNLLNRQSVTSVNASSKGSQFDLYAFQPARSALLTLKTQF